MAKGDYLGEFELTVMAAIIRLGDRAYGMRIRQVIQDRTGRMVSIGAVYATLDRLKSKGYISSTLADSTPERGGRAKQYYQIEAPGEGVYVRSSSSVLKMIEGAIPSNGSSREL
jgi:DNA-binding PadR family transcriptional regulator